MRNLLVLAAALGLAGVANAQNSATVNQTGDTNTATATQTAATNSTASITQTGAQQSSTVEQKNGDSNEATVIQNAVASTYGPGVQTSTVLQDGSRNSASVDMQQTGIGGKTANSATIEQVGNDNTISSQNLNAPSYNSGQHATALQYGNGNVAEQEVLNGYTQSLYLKQEGDNNDSDQQIGGGSNNTVETIQTGDGNISTQTVAGSNWGYASALAKIEQIGNTNTASQTLGGGGFSDLNDGKILQDGDLNMATQTVRVEGGSSGVNDGNVARISQTGGDSNVATQDVTGRLHNASITQVGGGNTAVQTMAAGTTGAEATFTQTGDSNVARLNQEGGDTLTLIQTGDGNILRGVAGADTAFQSGGSTAMVSQLGAGGNVVEMSQTDGGSATVMQDGSTNTATVVQN